MNSEITATLSTCGLVVTLGEEGHTWSVKLPHSYQNRVNGLCGTCSSTNCVQNEVKVK